MSQLAITVSFGGQRGAGRVVPLSGGDGLPARLSPEERLVLEIERLTAPSRWWSGSTFRGNRRRAENWICASVESADVDFTQNGEHAPVPADIRPLVDDAMKDAPSSLYHHTPRGLRLLGVYEEPIADLRILQLAQAALAEDVTTWLEKSGLHALGFRFDTAATDPARYFWAPNTEVENPKTGEWQRRCGVVLRTGALS